MIYLYVFGILIGGISGPFYLAMTRAAVEVDFLQKFRNLFPFKIWMLFGIVFALVSLLLGRWALLPRHLFLEDCVVLCVCQELLHMKCLLVTAYVFDEGNQLFDLLHASSVPFQLPKRCLCGDDVGHQVL